MTRYCTVCNKTVTSGCNYSITADVKETCIAAAYKTYECTDCGHGYTVIGNPATRHNFTSGDYKYNSANDVHAQFCANDGCSEFGVGTKAGEWEACTWDYENKEDGTHTATCVCENSQDEDCSGGTPTCTAPATCEKCNTSYGTTAPHSFTGNPVVLDGDVHAYRCEYCDDQTIYGVGENEDYTEGCSGGTATCTDKAKCTVCDDAHGEINPDNHKWVNAQNIEGTETHQYTCEYDSAHTKTEDCICTSPAVLAPDCETAGYQQNYCDDCGHGWQTNPTDALGHKWSAWVNNEDGTHTRTCERAGCVYNEETPGTAKTETASCTKDNAAAAVTAPTCIEEGYTTYTCSDCGYVWTDNYKNATGHSYTKQTKKVLADYKRSDKDCTTALTYWYCCDNCDVSAGSEKDKYDDEATLYWVKEEAAGHKFETKNTAAEYLKSAATCTAKAVYYYSCSVCGEKGETTFESGATLGHDWQNTEKYLKSSADCVNDEVYYKECSRCNITSEGLTNDTWTKADTKTGHDFDHDDDGVIGNEGDTGYVAGVYATCTDTGVLEHYNCYVCKKNFVDQEAATELTTVTINALGHDMKDVAYKAATCEEDGNSAHQACSRCYEKNSAYKAYTKLGHDFSGAYYCDTVNNYHAKYCKNSGCTDFGLDGVKYNVEHELDEAVVTGGEKCLFDSYTKSTVDGVHSHNIECKCGNSAILVITAENIDTEKVVATCTEDGYTLNTCTKDECGETWKTDIVTSAGHIWEKNATQNKDGKTHSVKCTKCDATQSAAKCSGGTATCSAKAKCEVCSSEYGETGSHVLADDNWTSSEDATCTVDGTEWQNCSVCQQKQTRTETGSALGHDMSADVYDISGWKNAPEDFNAENIKEPTCGAEGISISYCSRCDAYKTKQVPSNKDAHDMPEEWSLVGGNCATGVTYVRACTICGKKESKTESVPHSWKIIVVKEAGCTTNGYIDFECSVCGFTATLDDTDEGFPSFNGVDYSDKNIVATGNHTWQTEAPADKDYMIIDGVVVFVEKYPAYNATGRGYKKCTLCNTVENVTIAAYGNDPENHKHPELGINDNSTLKWVAKVEPTCTVGGHEGYWECTRCSYSQYVLDHDAYYIVALGHTEPNSKGKCDRCKTTLEEDSSSKNCSCICHKESGFMKFIYKILRFFWKLFGMNKTCSCGNVHY